jgi:hypothetical protein
VCQGQPLLTATAKTSTSILDSSFGGSVLADINGDGRLDLVFWTSEWPRPKRAGSFSVSLGKGGGTFASPQTYTLEIDIWSMKVVDFNHDGADDLFVVVTDDSGLEMRPGPRCAGLWLGSKDGTMVPSPDDPGVDCRRVLAFADLSGDGHVDVLAISEGGDSLEVYLSDRAGHVQFSKSYDWPSYGTLLVQDWNGDGFPDLIATGSSFQLRLNRGDGTFGDAVDCGILLGTYTVAADFNHDGVMDLATNLSSGVDVLLGLGGCGFSPAARYRATESCNLLPAADLDGDGQTDLLCMNNDVFTGFIGNPDGTFQAVPSIRLVGTAGLDAIVVGDVTGDGRPDVVAADRHGPVGVWENTCR